MKKKCELCNSTARVLCESDGAALCWDCDSNIHSSNFLFAKHIRSLLCNTCHSPTPWTGSGSTLARTLSLCDSCILAGHHHQELAGEEEQEQENRELAGDDDDSGGAGHDNEEDDDGDNQVVPLSSYIPPIQPPSRSSSNTQDLRRKFRFR